MQNESYVNKRLLRRFENTNKQILEDVGFLSFRIWFLISVLILIVVGNGLLLFFSMHSNEATHHAKKATPISFDMNRSTVTFYRKHEVSVPQKISINVPSLQLTCSIIVVPDGEKKAETC